MTTRDEILTYARQYGWRSVNEAFNQPCSLLLVRQSQPGGSRYGLYVEFDFDTESQVVYAEKQVGSTDTRLLGGVRAVKQYLRENGWQA